MTGELTELGGCFLGWPEGPQARYDIGVIFQDRPFTLNWGYMVPNSKYLGPNRG